MKKKIANWGMYPVLKSDEFTLRFQEEIQPYLKNTNHLIARGNGRCYGDASLAENTLSTLAFDHILDFNPDNGEIHCQAGLRLDKLLEFAMPRGWFLPVTPGTKFITTGGAVASDVHGKNHHSEGTFADHVSEFGLVTANGHQHRVNPLEQSELFRATAGGMGLTGIITDLKFKLKPITSNTIDQKTIKASNLTEAMAIFEENQHYTYSMAWIDCLQSGRNLGRSIIMVGEHHQGDPKSVITTNQGPKFNVPFNFPSFVLNQYSVKAFNFLYYHKELKKMKENSVGYDSFFYPLDGINNWNRMYGKRGFLQYQFVLPQESSAEGLKVILKRISDKKMGSFLAVLKQFGAANSNYLSFPMKGYTLALDFPVTSSLFPFLDELDQLVLQYGGRIYLSKDARMKKEVFLQSYPNLSEFKRVLHEYNDGKFESIQSMRLFDN